MTSPRGEARPDKVDRTKARLYESIARGLREFGYPDVTAAMVAEIHAAYKRGDSPLPHGVIGQFVKHGLNEAAK